VDGNSVPKYSNIPVIGVKNSLGWVLLTFTHGSNDFKISNPLEKGTVLTDGYERKTGTSMAYVPVICPAIFYSILTVV